MEKLEGTVEHRGGNNYRLRVTVGYNKSGNPIRTSKTVAASSVRKAYIALDNWIEELKEHGYKDISNITFGSFYEDVWKKEAPSLLEKRGYSDYVAHIELRFLVPFENVRLQEIKPYMIRKIVDKAKRLDGQEGELSKSTKKKMLNAVSSVFNLAKKDYRLITTNPVDDVELSRIGNKSQKAKKKQVDEPYSLKEIDLFLKAVSKPTTPLKTKALLYTAFITGARAGEMAAFEEDDIDFINKKVTFHQRIISYTEDGKQKWMRTDGLKSSDENIISVPDDYLDLMSEYIAVMRQARNELQVTTNHRYIFGGVDGSFDLPTSISRHWRRFAEREGLRVIRFHDLRHTSASFLIANPEIPIKVVQERLGHKDYRTTMNMYVSALEESDRLASDVFGTALNKDDEDDD
ncbi:MAG: site-specific integrase [Tetragenococcus koreensis]|nr:site-specific integrase [Tetragenococcus koreensis]